MNRQPVEQEPGEAFQYIGGQEMAVRTLRAVIGQEIEGIFPVRKPLVLLVGSAGMGKTVLLHETARALSAPLIRKTITDFCSEKGLHPSLIEAGYDEAKAAAANTGINKAVYAIEGIDVIMGVGPQSLMSEIFANTMTKWSEDHEGGVLVIATAIENDSLLPPVLSRFTQVQLTPPDKVRAADMCIKGMERLSAALKRTDVFDDLNGIEDLATRMVDLGWTARDITNHLRRAIILRQKEQPWQSIDTSFLEALMPPVSRKLGFRHS